MITIFTPTYNRAYSLPRLYNSIKKQTFQNFEWLIIDDGSTDNTKELVSNFMKENLISIRYFFQENGGKHRAINKAVTLAKGELFFIVDSDDWLPDNSLKIIENYYLQIKNSECFAGVVGCKATEDLKISGTTFKGNVIDGTFLERKKLNINGEKAEVFKTDLLKKYPFPEFEGENFISEAIVWNKIAYDEYKVRFFNEIVYFFEYQLDGLSENLRNNYKNNPIGYLTYVAQELNFLKVGFLKKLYLCGKCINTVDCKIVSNEKIKEILNLTFLTFNFAKLIYSIKNILYRRKNCETKA